MWSRVWYELRVTANWLSLVFVLSVPFVVGVDALRRLDTPGLPDVRELLGLLEIVLPLVGALSSAHLMAVERDTRFDEVRRTTPEPTWYLPLLRTLQPFAVVLFGTGLAVAAWQSLYGPVTLRQAVFPALPPTLFMIALSLLVGNLAGNVWIPSGLTLIYWLVNVQVGSQVFRELYLFQASIPNPRINTDANRLLLLASAGLLAVLNVAYSAWRRRRG